MQQQRIIKKEPAAKTTVIDVQKTPAGVAARTVIFVEIGGATAQQFAEVAQRFSAEYQGSPMGHHYFVPVRNGQLQNDPLFEEEFLKVVREVCEVKDGEIAMKGGATPVKVVRNFVD